ncbi:MAG TPA: isoprenylcysteine carboxylmethyltransferase family protein [Candidatus Nanopelagicaceae bacterium]
MMSERPNQLQAWSYVFVQALLLLLLVFLDANIGPQIHRFVFVGRTLEGLGIIGVLVCAASLRRSLTVAPIPKEDGQLSTTGLYQYVRHPMYSSVLLFALGIALSSGSLIKYLLTLLLYLLFHAKSTYEEKYLKLKYPDYAEYASRIPRFIPFTK